MIVTTRGFEFKLQKDQAEIAGQFQMLQYAVAQMNVAGPNAAMAGKDPREQLGRAIIARQSGGQMENEPLADSLRQWTHKVHEAAWMRVRQFWTGPRWIRVTDNNKNVQFVGLNRPVTIASLLDQLDKDSPLPDQLAALPPDDARAVRFGLSLPSNDPRLQAVPRVDNDIGDMDCTITVEEGPDNPTMQAEPYVQFVAVIFGEKPDALAWGDRQPAPFAARRARCHQLQRKQRLAHATVCVVHRHHADRQPLRHYPFTGGNALFFQAGQVHHAPGLVVDLDRRQRQRVLATGILGVGMEHVRAFYFRLMHRAWLRWDFEKPHGLQSSKTIGCGGAAIRSASAARRASVAVMKPSESCQRRSAM